MAHHRTASPDGGDEQRHRLLRRSHRRFLQPYRRFLLEYFGPAIDYDPNAESDLPKGIKSEGRSRQHCHYGTCGNPPYLRIQDLKRIAPADVEWYREHYTAAQKGNYDLYVVFIERALKLLRGHGQLGFICPHRFFHLEYGEPIRELISRGRHLRHVVHFGNEQIFPGATNYVCLLFLSRDAAEFCRVVKSGKLKEWLATQAGQEGTFTARSITRQKWHFVVGAAAAPFERLENMPNKLGEVTDLFVGIQTDADDVFLLQKQREDEEYVWCSSEFTGQTHPFERTI
ncbi:MAG: Eco57I restriction-modification methylase domain-containing protein [Chthoniobacterales bacterium]|nr:Eco57I restriction-modification methylase domain-containing protein [Chthoniobacterales bacterium]